MKVEKIDIKKELMEIPDGKQWIDFAFWEPIEARFVNYGDIPRGTITGRQGRYEVQKLKHSTEKEPKYYLVAVDDRRIFQDLVMISDSTFNQAINDKTDYYKDWMKRELQEQRGRILELPWWKRLFKRF
jgi:hypothetical protein